jgi:hypothetical protein
MANEMKFKTDVSGKWIPIHELPKIEMLAQAPQREWQSLTLEEREELRDRYEGSVSGFISAIEAKLKEKNG